MGLILNAQAFKSKRQLSVESMFTCFVQNKKPKILKNPLINLDVLDDRMEDLDTDVCSEGSERTSSDNA